MLFRTEHFISTTIHSRINRGIPEIIAKNRTDTGIYRYRYLWTEMFAEFLFPSELPIFSFNIHRSVLQI